MRIISSVLVLAAVIFFGPGMARVSAADDDGVALAILYDTSGSMRDSVPARNGQTLPKYVIANHALISIVQQIEAFTTNSSTGEPRRVDVGLYIFDKGAKDKGGAKEVVPLGKFQPESIREFAENFKTPAGGTPLGNALSKVSKAVLDSPLPHKHVLIITDGMNTVGPDPAEVLPKIRRQAEKLQQTVDVHFIAFDVNADVFAGVKKHGATVVAAADETQLNAKLDFILQNQILLEKPSKTK